MGRRQAEALVPVLKVTGASRLASTVWIEDLEPELARLRPGDCVAVATHGAVI